MGIMTVSDFKKQMAKVEGNNKTSDKLKDSRGEKKREGYKELRQRAYDYLKEDPVNSSYTRPGSPVYIADPQLLPNNISQPAFESGITLDDTIASRHYSNDLEGILGAIEHKQIAKLAHQNVIIANADEDYQSFLKGYEQVEAAEQLIERAKTGKLHPEEYKVLVEPIARAVTEKKKKELMSKPDYTEDVAEGFAQIEALAVRSGAADKDLMIAGAESFYKDRVKELGADYKDKLKGYVTGALKKLASNDSSNQEYRTSRELAYKAVTGKL